MVREAHGQGATTLPRERERLEPAAQHTADVLASMTDEIAARWLQLARETIYGARPDLSIEEIGGDIPALLRGIEADLRGSEPGLEATWANRARRHAEQRIAQGVSLRDVTREFELVRQETLNVLHPPITLLTTEQALDVTARLDAALAALAGITIDVYDAERRSALLARLEERSRLEAVLRQAPAGVLIVEPGTYHLLMGNPQAEQILGQPLRLGEDIRLAIAPQGWLRADGSPYTTDELPVARSLTRGETVVDEPATLPANTGTHRHVAVSSAPLHTPDGRIAAAVVTIADQTHTRELEELRDDLLRAVSHDLRNPLAAVLGQGQLLERRMAKSGIDGPLTRSVAAITNAAQRMNIMIQDLVDAARFEYGQLRLTLAPVDERAVLLDMLRSPAAMPAERVRVDAPEGLPPVMGDQERVRRILMNLITSALRYAAPDSQVTVQMHTEDGQVLARVTAPGPGIPSGELAQLLARPASLSAVPSTQEVAGAGLYITRALVEAHGGRLWADSIPEQGNTFSFTLPIAGGGADR